MSRPPSKPPQNNFFFKPPANFGLVNEANKLFQQGFALLNQGRLEQARETLEKVVKLNAKHVDAIHLLGIIAAQLKELEHADSLFHTAIKLNPNNAAFYCNRGNVLKELKQLEKAVSYFDKAIFLNKDYALAYLNRSLALFELKQFEEALKSSEKAIYIKLDYAEAYHQHGLNLEELKRFDEALASYDKAIELKHNFAEAYSNRGIVLNEFKRFDEALASYDKAIELKPDYAEAYLNRGTAEKELKLNAEALASYEKAIELKHDFAEAFYNRGILLKELRRLDEALESYDKAIELQRDYAEAYSNRGIVLTELKRLEEALTSYDRAIELKSDYAESYLNRGNVLQELKRLEEALTSYDRAIEFKSDFADAYFNKSLLLLSLQDFENGWQLYDWRWKQKKFESTYLSSNKPKLINIESAHNKKLLIWGEQGVGDQILYTSMIDQLLNISPSSQILLDKRLLPLLHRSFPQGKFIDKTLAIECIEHDEHLPIADLGKYFRTCNSDFDITRHHYLLADQQRAKKIRSSLISNKKFLCGITWSSTVKKIGAEKSIQLEDLLPVLSLKDIAFVSLQYGNIHKHLADFNEKQNINILECDSVDNFYDLDGHAALIEACDFVVTISNTSAHIAGAIGKEAYLMCPSGKGLLWYWSNQKNGNSLWYPSIKIYKQNAPGQWFDVIQKIKLAIEKKINEIE